MCVCVYVCGMGGEGGFKLSVSQGARFFLLFAPISSGKALTKKKHYFGDSSGAEHLASSRRDPGNEAIGHLLCSFTQEQT